MKIECQGYYDQVEFEVDILDRIRKKELHEVNISFTENTGRLHYRLKAKIHPKPIKNKEPFYKQAIRFLPFFFFSALSFFIFSNLLYCMIKYNWGWTIFLSSFPEVMLLAFPPLFTYVAYQMALFNSPENQANLKKCKETEFWANVARHHYSRRR